MHKNAGCNGSLSRSMTRAALMLAIGMIFVRTDGHDFIKVEGVRHDADVRVCIYPMQVCLEERSDRNGVAKVNVDNVGLIGTHLVRIEEKTRLENAVAHGG